MFAIDTSAVHPDIVQHHKHLPDELNKYTNIVKQKLSEQPHRPNKDKPKTWNVAFCHHPCYTRGFDHAEDAVKLRHTFHMEERLSKIDAIFSGHEHVMQFKYHNNIAHVVSGAVIKANYYLGVDEYVKMDWHDEGMNVGFVHTTITKTQMIIKYIARVPGATYKLIYEKIIEK